MRITINSAEVDVLAGTLNIDDAIEERSTASFTVYDKQGTQTFHKGEPVEIQDSSGNTLMTGFIDKPQMQSLPGTKVRFHSISCVDNHYLADKRIIAKAYSNMIAGDIIRDFITNYLAAEGITEGTIQDGETINSAIFNYVSITKAIEILAEKADYWWTIDSIRKLHFMDRSANIAPWVCTRNDIQAETLNVGESATKYRNKQYVKGGTDTTDPLTERFKGDGAARTWSVGFKINSEPTIKINGTAVTSTDIGIRGVETNKKYYWNKGETQITQDESQAVLSSSDTIEITYIGQFSIVAITEDLTAIDTMKETEGVGTGIVEDVADEPENENREAAFQSGNAKLKKYAAIGTKVEFQTLRYGLQPGQLLTMDIPEAGLDNTEVLIESINTTDDDGTFLRHNVTAISGAEEGSWTKVFERIATKGQVFVIRENISESEVLVTLASFSKAWLQSDQPNIFKTLYPGNTIYPGSTLYPMFDYKDRVKFIEFLNGSNTVLTRKAFIKQTGADTNTIVSTAFIAPYELIGQTIAKVRFYGGANATEMPGTGMVIDEQIYGRTKTDLEAIQVEKTDTKGW